MTEERQLAEAALQRFPVAPRRITRVARSFNAIFRIETSDGTYALRVGMARLHDHADGRRADGVLRADRVLYWRLPDRLGEVPDHGAVLAAARDSVQRVVDELWRRPAYSPRLLHGDLTPANVIEAPGAGAVPIDFQDMVVGFPEQDISFTLASFRRHHDRDDLSRALQDGYRQIRRWPDVPDAVMRALLVARGLHQLNLSLATATGPLPRDYLADHASRARDWLAGHG